MGNQLTDPPLTYTAGTEFDYAVWEPGTEIVLCNVPWDSVYRNTVIFGATNATPTQRRAALNAYIDNLETPTTRLPGGSPVRVDVPVRVGLSHNLSQKYNYLRARNPLLPTGANPNGDEQRDYYYFILGTRYINPGVTELTLQLDVWQTYIYDAVIGESYVERSHLGIANTNQFANNGRDYLTVPEGIDIGSEYRIVTTRKEEIDGGPTGGQSRYNILICSAVDLNADPGDVNDPENPPKLVTASGSLFSGIAAGASYYVLENAQNLQVFMDYWKDKPWLTQGILSITLIPPIRRYLPNFNFSGGVDGGLTPAPAQLKVSTYHDLYPNWRDNFLNALPSRYRSLRKLLTFPYTAIELTTYTGSPVVLKPEAWNNPNASIIERPALIPPSQRVIFFPRFYNTTGNPVNSIDDDDPGEYYDIMTQIAGFPSVALVNNAHIGYLASNMNARNAAYSSADWSQQRAMRGAQVGYDNAMAGINAARQQTEASNQYQGASLGITQQLERDLQYINAIGGTLLQGTMGLAAGPRAAGLAAGAGVGGGLVNGITMGEQQRAAQQQLGALVNQNWRATDINNAQTQLVSDANRGLAEWGARGDYEQVIASLDAKAQDAALLQPSVSGQTGGEFMHLIHETLQVAARFKMIDNAAVATVGEYWLRFGYAVHRRYTPPSSLAVMSKFTYWKLGETNLRASYMPEGMKNALRGILEKGTTVYKNNPDEIGMVDFATNTPLSGVSL